VIDPLVLASKLQTSALLVQLQQERFFLSSKSPLTAVSQIRLAERAEEGQDFDMERTLVSPCFWAMAVVITVQLRVVAALRVGYYAQSCPNAEMIVRNAMERGMQQDSGTAPGVLRLHFHDCFVDVCNSVTAA